MGGDSDSGIEGEIVRVEAVRYLEGSVGHAVGSLVFVLVGSVIWLSGNRTIGGFVLSLGFLVSGNGLSIWAWTRLQTYFGARTGTSQAETRSLKPSPLDKDSIVTLKTGAVIVPTFVVILGVGLGAVQELGLVVAGSLFLGVLVLGNLAAIAYAVSR